jgi:hypothetical protein
MVVGGSPNHSVNIRWIAFPVNPPYHLENCHRGNRASLGSLFGAFGIYFSGFGIIPKP